MKRFSVIILALVGVGTLAASTTSPLNAQGQGLAVGRPEWAAAERHDTGRPLREMTPMPATSTRKDFEVKQATPAAPGQPDQAVQAFAVAPLSATTGANFDGVGENNGQFPFNVQYAPPDTTGEAGLTQYVQWVNSSFAVYDKASGTKVYGPAGGNTIWSGFGGDCATNNDGDPIVQYDQLADRWVMTQFSLTPGNYLQCVAVSATSDATGAWHRYAFPYAQFPDYPKLSVWPDAYYITFNMFGTNGTNFSGGKVCAYDRAKMLNGQAASQVCYNTSTSYGSLLPSDLDGKTLPPAGTPNYVMNKGGASTLNLWKFTPNFAVPANSSFVGPTSVAVSAFTAACGRSCISQPDTNQKLDVLGDRLMYRLAYRNLGTREALVVNHSVIANSLTTIRWYELDITNGVPSVRQQSTYAPNDGQNRWMGSAAMDQAGNIAIGYTIGSATLKPSIRFAGRDVNDPLNTLSIEDSIKNGSGSQLATLSRWGDYSTLALDPVDDCTFWYTTEYLQVNGTFNWSTRVGSFKFSSCGTTVPPTPTFSLAATPGSQTTTQGQSTSFDVTVTPVNGYAGNGSFTVSGLPAGVTGTFSPADFSNGAYSSTLNITAASNSATGTYPLTITATDASSAPVQSTSVTLTVNAAVAPDFTISATPGNRVIKRGDSGTYTVTVTATGGFNGAVSFGVSGGPGNTSYVFSPASVTGSGTTTLTVGTAIPGTPKGTYTLIITGSDGSKSRSATVSLKVQ